MVPVSIEGFLSMLVPPAVVQCRTAKQAGLPLFLCVRWHVFVVVVLARFFGLSLVGFF